MDEHPYIALPAAGPLPASVELSEGTTVPIPSGVPSHSECAPTGNLSAQVPLPICRAAGATVAHRGKVVRQETVLFELNSCVSHFTL